MKYLGWWVLGVLIGAAIMWAIDHKSLLENRKKISGANQVVEGLENIFGGGSA